MNHAGCAPKDRTAWSGRADPRAGFLGKPRGQGTGLGLVLVQRVVKRGVLQFLRSETLGGARFEARWGEAP